MNRNVARALFGAIFLFMIWITVWSSLEESVVAGFFHVIQYRWGWATLADAYFAFLTFYVWVFTREKSAVARVCWFVGIMLLGNLAMSAYVLWQLRGTKPLFEVKA